MASFSSVGSFVFEFLDASFPNLVSYSSFTCIIFQHRGPFFFFVSFYFLSVSYLVFEFSVLSLNDHFLSTTNRVYSDDCALQRFGVVVSLRCFKSLLYLLGQSRIERGH